MKNKDEFNHALVFINYVINILCDTIFSNNLKMIPYMSIIEFYEDYKECCKTEICASLIIFRLALKSLGQTIMFSKANTRQVANKTYKSN